MDKFTTFLKSNQQTLVLVIGYLLVASIGFGLGRFTEKTSHAPEIRVEEAFAAPSNYSPNISGAQTDLVTAPVKTTATCDGKIKGSSSGIYHIPGGAFYTKTTKPTRCFDTESQAQAAGFRKSSR